MTESATAGDAKFGKQLTIIGTIWTIIIVSAGVGLLTFQDAIAALF